MEVLFERRLLSKIKRKYSKNDYLKILKTLEFIQNNDLGTLLRSRKVKRLRGFFINHEDEILYSYRVTLRIRMIFTVSRREKNIYILDFAVHDQLRKLKGAAINNSY